jgi:hypothetical protein
LHFVMFRTQNCIPRLLSSIFYSKQISLNIIRYFYSQVDLTEPILSRFDILCVVRDTVDPVQVIQHFCRMFISFFLLFFFGLSGSGVLPGARNFIFIVLFHCGENE